MGLAVTLVVSNQCGVTAPPSTLFRATVVRHVDVEADVAALGGDGIVAHLKERFIQHGGGSGWSCLSFQESLLDCVSVPPAIVSIISLRLASDALTLLVHRIDRRHYVLRDCRSDNRIHLHGRFDFAQYCLLVQPANSTQADMHLVPGIAAGLRIGAPSNREHHLAGDLLIIHCLVSGHGLGSNTSIGYNINTSTPTGPGQGVSLYPPRQPCSRSGLDWFPVPLRREGDPEVGPVVKDAVTLRDGGVPQLGHRHGLAVLTGVDPAASHLREREAVNLATGGDGNQFHNHPVPVLLELVLHAVRAVESGLHSCVSGWGWIGSNNQLGYNYFIPYSGVRLGLYSTQ